MEISEPVEPESVLAQKKQKLSKEAYKATFVQGAKRCKARTTASLQTPAGFLAMSGEKAELVDQNGHSSTANQPAV